MDIQQLKLLAGHIRGLLQQSNSAVTHNQALDLAAALPGLRNWPEVIAFPERVTATELDRASTGRLAFRLNKRFGLNLAPQDLLKALTPPGSAPTQSAPQIWPAGPQPGIYFTTSPDAIGALLEQYEEATDGALVYAERAGNSFVGSIDLGDYGLWSAGLDRVPSGTLLVIGPLELDQQSWNDVADRIEIACLHVLNSGHRVAVLIDTPHLEALHEDIQLMVTSRPNHSDEEVALLGVVTEDGELKARTPFAGAWPQIVQAMPVATEDGIPVPLLAPLRDALAGRTSGLLMFGSSVITEHSAIELVAASLALTEHVGPAARIMPRHRSTPSKDWMVPEAIRQLPYLPSIESAYAQGYRRLIYTPGYTRADRLIEYGTNALLISGTFGCDVSEVFMGSGRAGSITEEQSLMDLVIAIAATVPLTTTSGEASINDLYVATGKSVTPLKKFKEIDEFLTTRRLVRWEDDLSHLLDTNAVSREAVIEAFPRNRGVDTILAKYRAKRPRQVA